MEELVADGNEVVEEDDVAHESEEDEGEERGGGGEEIAEEGEEREDWGECWATLGGVGEDTPLSPHDEERDEEEGNGRWGLEEWEREVAEEEEEENGFLGFGATRGGVLLPALVGDGEDPPHGQSAKSAGGETSTLSRAGEGGGDGRDSSVLHAFGGATTSLPLIPSSGSVSSVL